MKTRTILVLAAIAMIAAGLSLPAADQPSKKKGPGIKLDLEGSNRSSIDFDMAVFGQAAHSEVVKRFYTDARQALEKQKNAGVADLKEVLAAADEHGLLLPGGPMLGGLSHEGARVWVRTAKPAQVTVVVKIGTEDRKFGPVATTAASDLTATIPVIGLKPDTRYPYQVLVDGRSVPIPADAAIHTTPTDAGRMGIAFGADFHKTGLWNQALLDRIRSRGNSAIVLLGDLAACNRRNMPGLLRADYLLRDTSPGWKSLAASLAVYATWDDHDYWDNDISGIPRGFTPADRSMVRAVWMQNWNNPSYGMDNQGIYFHARIGPCDLIMLDTRFFRHDRGAPDCFLGAEQMRWLEAELASCTAPFVILTGGTMWSDYVSKGKDSWGTWDPPARERIFSLIENKRIGGVLLLSGDRHGARVLRIPRPSGFSFHEFEMGSLGGHAGPAATGSEPGLQDFGLVETPLFGEFTFDTTAQDPTVTMRAVDADGKERYQVTLTRSRLTPGKNR